MNPSHPLPNTQPANTLRAERRTAGLVAEYIHELSDRHAGDRERGRLDFADAPAHGRRKEVDAE